MRRTLVLLAVIAAGFWSGSAQTPAGAAPSDPPRAQQLTDVPGAGSQAFLRAGAALPLVAWQDATGSRGHSLSARATSTDDDAHARAANAPFVARARAHPEHTAGLALIRAGRASFHTATPPPFRSV